ncbi:MMPL family transporter [Neobacillus novalis]|uniref:MMPL family transporter n=1 Tax=Neobacillus novalis TaxID=220687 RepID=A0AA95MTE9_9BACI|nr:MMPL family transporter [Neobacillus novalis]WHY89027.1 MMPL family transporter [Neobacillus novalis]
MLILALNGLLPQANSQKNERADTFLEETDATKASDIIDREFSTNKGIPALLTWYKASSLSDNDLASIQGLTKKLTDQPIKGTFVPPFHDIPLPVLKNQVSKDGTTLVLPIVFDKNLETAEISARLGELKKTAKSIFPKDPFRTSLKDEENLVVRVTGPAGVAVDATELFSQGDLSLLIGTVMIVLLFLLIIYRSPILALIPLVGVGMAYMLISPILGVLGKEGVIDYDAQAISIMTVLLFGAGTDYCLFLIAQFRKNLREEEDKFIAIRRAFSLSSGAIFMSGLTVVVSLLVLLVANYGSVHRFAIPFSLAILIMMAASLSLIPALLSILGRTSFYPFVPRTEEMTVKWAAKKGKVVKAPKDKANLGEYVGKVVSYKPWRVAAITLIILGVFALFSTKMETTYDTLSSFPKDMPSREGFDLLSKKFNPGELAPVSVIVKGSGSEANLKEKLENLPFVAEVSNPVKGEKDSSIVKYELALNMNPYSNEAMAHIPELKKDVQSFIKQSGGDDRDVWIGGMTAEQYDTKQTTKADSSLVIPLIIGLIAILLLLYLRSIIATVYLIGTVLLSYFSALGLGWIILHYGFGVEAIQGFIPLYAFVFIVALGEDYNIFMISSIWRKSKEMPLKRAIKEGVSETGGVITSAGIILAATFTVLTTLPIQVLVHFGTITAIGILLDTFIVRPFLVPALTSIFGQWAFWPSKKRMDGVRILKEKEVIRN